MTGPEDWQAPPPKLEIAARDAAFLAAHPGPVRRCACSCGDCTARVAGPVCRNCWDGRHHNVVRWPHAPSPADSLIRGDMQAAGRGGMARP